MHDLAGVDTILTKAYSICSKIFALSSASIVGGSTGLLITGRTGAGKTSVAQATAKALQWNPSVFACEYIDVHCEQ